MSVNPAIANNQPLTVSPDEIFISNHDECEFFIESGSGYPGQGGMFYGTIGKVFVSNLRVVYIEMSTRATFQSFSLPFYCITKWKFQRPYLGLPSWSGSINPVPSGGLQGIGFFKISFRNRNIEAFENSSLPFLISSREIARRIAQQETPTVMLLPTTIEEKKEETKEEHLEKAFIDPDDPFYIHLSLSEKKPRESNTRTSL